eukprot:8960906-Ditylum_brightwellii.AAC.1
MGAVAVWIQRQTIHEKVEMVPTLVNLGKWQTSPGHKGRTTGRGVNIRRKINSKNHFTTH